jgi:chemosensory pili system protein ChpE/L-lysine exporter family protein LysE/ArgO
MLLLLVSAFGLGLVFNAAPGAVFAETVRQGMHGGFRAAFAVQAGSLAGDALWAALGLAGAGVLLQLEVLRWPLGITGAAYLAWLARDSWRAARLNTQIDKTGARSTREGLRSGVLLSITNPQNLAYWAAVGSAMAGLGVTDPQPLHYLVFFAGFMASSVVWCFVCATLVSKLASQAGPRWASVTHRLCAIALLALACASVRDLFELTCCYTPARVQPGHQQARP